MAPTSSLDQSSKKEEFLWGKKTCPQKILREKREQNRERQKGAKHG